MLFHADHTTHLFDQLFANGEPEARAAKFSGGEPSACEKARNNRSRA